MRSTSSGPASNGRRLAATVAVTKRIRLARIHRRRRPRLRRITPTNLHVIPRNELSRSRASSQTDEEIPTASYPAAGAEAGDEWWETTTSELSPPTVVDEVQRSVITDLIVWPRDDATGNGR